jgi:membrane associated rhomboid family serine protease
VNNSNNPNNYIRGAPVPDEENIEASQMFGILGGMRIGTGPQAGKSPRDYNYGDFWTQNFCPNCTTTSFPFLVWMFNTAVYAAELIIVAIQGDPLSLGRFLGPMPGFLNKFQIMNPYEVRNNYQWWRPLSALFITNGFEQYMFSTAYLLLFGYMLASTKMSNLRMLVFYCLCGYVGNMFGAICDSNGALFCGDSPATFGMFAAMISCLCVNWHALDSMPQMRCPLIFTLVMFTMMLMLNSAGGSAFNDLLAFHTH